jgi:hypothetical protein
VFIGQDGSYIKDINRDIELASSGSEEDLRFLAHHTSPEVLGALLQNKNLTEDIALIIAHRKNIGPEILESLFHDIRWKNCYRIMLALCKNPKTPQRISLSLIKSLRIFDLADLARNQFIPVSVKMKAESDVVEKIPYMTLGNKLTLAKRAGGNILMRLLEDGKKEVVGVCLDNPQMTEDVIYKIVSKETVSPQVIRQIAEHPKWSLRYQIQWGLIRNNHAPLSRVLDFLMNLKTRDLKELYEDPEVPSSTKPFIYSKLSEREEG